MKVISFLLNVQFSMYDLCFLTVIYKHIQVKNISIEYCKKFPHQEANKTKNYSQENLHRFQRRLKRGQSAIMSDDELQYV